MSGHGPVRPFPAWLPPLVARLDYGALLPLLARLPRRVGQPLAALRGQLNWHCDFDWRTLSLGHPYVRTATLAGMRALAARRYAVEVGDSAEGQAGASSGQDLHLSATSVGAAAGRWTRQRYACTAREEVDAWRLARLDFGRLRCEFVGLEALRAAQARGQGVLLAKAHFDALYIGLGALAHRGVRLNLMGTRTIFDARIPPAIRRHYEMKTAALNQVLAPGRLAFFEDGMAFFVRALRRGEAVAMACDGPSSSPQRATPVRLLGRRLLMSSGLEFLARATGAPIAFLSCQELPGQRFRITISPPMPLEEGGLQQAYDALERTLLAHPGGWWAADQYANYLEAPPP